MIPLMISCIHNKQRKADSLVSIPMSHHNTIVVKVMNMLLLTSFDEHQNLCYSMMALIILLYMLLSHNNMYTLTKTHTLSSSFLSTMNCNIHELDALLNIRLHKNAADYSLNYHHHNTLHSTNSTLHLLSKNCTIIIISILG